MRREAARPSKSEPSNESVPEVAKITPGRRGPSVCGQPSCGTQVRCAQVNTGAVSDLAVRRDDRSLDLRDPGPSTLRACRRVTSTSRSPTTVVAPCSRRAARSTRDRRPPARRARARRPRPRPREVWVDLSEVELHGLDRAQRARRRPPRAPRPLRRDLPDGPPRRALEISGLHEVLRMYHHADDVDGVGLRLGSASASRELRVRAARTSAEAVVAGPLGPAPSCDPRTRAPAARRCTRPARARPRRAASLRVSRLRTRSAVRASRRPREARSPAASRGAPRIVLRRRGGRARAGARRRARPARPSAARSASSSSSSRPSSAPPAPGRAARERRAGAPCASPPATAQRVGVARRR